MVAKFPHIWLHSILPGCVLHPLLYNKGEHLGAYTKTKYLSTIVNFQLDIVGSASTFLYFGYTSVMVFCFFLLTGELMEDNG